MYRLALVRKSTGEILDRNATYFKGDLSLPPDGLDPDLEYLIFHEPYPAPTYDSRIFKLSITEEISTDPHPVYAHFNQFKVTFTTAKRINEEIEQAVKSREVSANNGVVPQEKFNKLVLLAVGVLFRQVEDQVLTTKEIAIKDKALAAAVKLWKNDQTLRDKIQEISDGLEPDIDAGWDEIDAA